MKIDDFFVNEYLTPGNTYDNFIFENCPEWFLKVAKEKLSNGDNNIKSCCVAITKETEQAFEQILSSCKEEFHKKVLARDLIVAYIMKELLSDKKQENSYAFVCKQIDAFMNNDFEAVKSMHIDSFMPYDVKKFCKDFTKIELNIFLFDMSNKYLQQAINCFISAREPYSVKMFITAERLSTYYDIDGNIIECPHDFMRRDINKFITFDNGKEI